MDQAQAASKAARNKHKQQARSSTSSKQYHTAKQQARSSTAEQQARTSSKIKNKHKQQARANNQQWDKPARKKAQAASKITRSKDGSKEWASKDMSKQCATSKKKRAQNIQARERCVLALVIASIVPHRTCLESECVLLCHKLARYE